MKGFFQATHIHGIFIKRLRRSLFVAFGAVRVFPALLFLALFLSAQAAGADDRGEEPGFKESSSQISGIPEESVLIPESVSARPEYGKVAYACMDQQGHKICMNDTCSDHVEQVARGMPRISPNGKHYAALVQRDDQARVMLDGAVSGGYDMVHSIAFSPDSRQMAYLAQKDEDFFVYVNQDRHPSFPLIDPGEGLRFSRNSEHLVYVARTDEDEWVVVKNGEPGAAFDAIKHVTFSPDSTRLVYAAKKGDSWHLVEGLQGNKQGGAYQDIAHVSFGPESEKIAYIARKNDTSVMVVNGEESDGYDEIPGEPVFSPDGGRLAYAVAEQRRGDFRMRMAVDDEVGPDFDRVGAYRFSPDGEDFAYMAEEGGTGRIVHNGEKHESYDSVGIPIFSPKGGRLAYMVLDDQTWHIWEDGEKGPGFNRLQNPVFSPDGKRMAYLARMDEHYMVIENDEIVGTYQWAGNLRFSRDGQMVYTAARDGESFLVVDGMEGEERFLSFLRGAPLVFLEDNVVQIIGLREEGREFHLLRAEIGK